MADTKYSESRAPILANFAKMKPLPESQKINISPSGRYSLTTTKYTSGPQSWNYSRGIVRDLATDRIVADVIRNYGHFWFAWASLRKREFLLCGEDYQGYNVIDLEKAENVLTFPKEAFDGYGFCWAAVHPSPSGHLLAVEGCYWGGPYDLVFYDFSAPMRSLAPGIGRIEDLEETFGWIDQDRFRYAAGEDGDLRLDIWCREN